MADTNEYLGPRGPMGSQPSNGWWCYESHDTLVTLSRLCDLCLVQSPKHNQIMPSQPSVSEASLLAESMYN